LNYNLPVVTCLFGSNNVPSGDLVGPVQGNNKLHIKAWRGEERRGEEKRGKGAGPQ
jgi:hypothetical protein